MKSQKEETALNSDNKANTATKTSTQVGEKQKPIIMILGFTTILASLLAGFFIYQTQKLTKEISSIKSSQAQATPAPTQTPDPTADWKTYTDPEKSYSFMYPPTWYVERFDNGREIIYNADENVSLAISINPSQMDTLCWSDIETTDSQLKVDNFPAQKSLYESIYHESGTDCVDPTYRNLRMVHITWEKDNKKYQISYSYDKSKEELYSKILDQILSTFKFTD